MINIVYEDNHILVVEKPINVLVQQDITNDNDMLSLLKKYLKEKYHKPGNVYLGLIHRLDRPVGGLMVFAKTSKAASRLNNQMRKKEIKKKYFAVVENILKIKEGKLIDYLEKDNKTNITKISENGKLSILKYKVISEKNNLSLIEIELETGRSHQIRIQFSSRNNPLYGDQKYNSNSQKKEQIALFSYYLKFNHPTTKEDMEFILPLPKTKPWTLF